MGRRGVMTMTLNRADSRDVKTRDGNPFLQDDTSPEQRAKVISRNASDKPIFGIQDVAVTTHPLAQIVRYMMYKMKISEDDFKQLHRDMAMRTCMTTNKASFDKSNTYRSLTNLDITWAAFDKFLNILQVNLIDLMVVLESRKTGEITVWKRSDAVAEAMKIPYDSNALMSKLNSVAEGLAAIEQEAQK